LAQILQIAHRENSTQNQLCGDSGKIISRLKYRSHTAGRLCELLI